MEKRLVRRQDDRMLFGVAAGIAAYLNIDPVLVRLIFVIMTLAG
ncbi:MAG: PspC domain-containing protein, partial [Anaerolineales bacterium]|nr:PspC domain-containing protein [Anaerolineales bacterium]